jgi:16S rRNA (cytidine1402-2'-O)-methyltransferase
LDVILRLGILPIVAILYIVATPIGHLGDITFRAVEVLKSVGLVACEDTRQTLKLLNHLGIKTRLISCRARNEGNASTRIVAFLDEGTDVAYASDAGTPAVSDPGSVLVRSVVEAGHRVIPIPGASAFASLVSVAGGLDKTVLFEGFLSPKAGRRRSRLRELFDSEAAFVVYESPYRILKLLDDLADIDMDRYICVGREMTKVHEEYLRGSIAAVRDTLASRDKQLGEFSVYVSGKKSAKLLE